jgi:hypothetical protein
MRLADEVLKGYESKTKARADSLPVSSLDDMKKDVLNRLLDTKNGLVPEARAVLRTRLNLGPEVSVPAPPATNAPPKTTVEAPI